MTLGGGFCALAGLLRLGAGAGAILVGLALGVGHRPVRLGLSARLNLMRGPLGRLDDRAYLVRGGACHGGSGRRGPGLQLLEGGGHLREVGIDLIRVIPTTRLREVAALDCVAVKLQLVPLSVPCSVWAG